MASSSCSLEQPKSATVRVRDRPRDQENWSWSQRLWQQLSAKRCQSDYCNFIVVRCSRCSGKPLPDCDYDFCYNNPLIAAAFNEVNPFECGFEFGFDSGSGDGSYKWFRFRALPFDGKVFSHAKREVRSISSIVSANCQHPSISHNQLD